MFNVTVIRLKDVIKYPVVFAIIMIVMYFATRYFFNENKISEPKINIAEKIKASLSEYSLYPIETEMPIIEVTINAQESTNEEKFSLFNSSPIDSKSSSNKFALSSTSIISLS